MTASTELPIIVVVDLETTANVAGTCGVCQVGAVALIAGEKEMQIVPMLELYCRPSEPVTPEALAVHGITPEYYANAPLDVTALWVLEQAVLGLRREVVFAGYNSTRFDLPIIRRLLPSDTVGAGRAEADATWQTHRGAVQGRAGRLPDLGGRHVDGRRAGHHSHV